MDIWTVHALLDTGTAHWAPADEPVLRPGGRAAASLKSTVSGHRSRCDWFYFSVSFTSQFVICLSLNSEARSRRITQPTVGQFVQHVLSPSLFQVPPRLPLRIKRSASRPTTTTVKKYTFTISLPRTSLRGIGLCNGYDTNFPYKWTS
jgi:hypothetical protein